jgi:2-C-methyl-D-erythritol 4-phosphate cytidylyltransferase
MRCSGLVPAAVLLAPIFLLYSAYCGLALIFSSFGVFMPRFAVVLPAAGQSSRFGGAEKKPFLDLAGRAVWLRAADVFAARADVCQLLVVVASDDVETFAKRFAADVAALKVEVVAGGNARFESVANALARLRPEVDFVAVHDAARPCITPTLIDAVFARAADTGAAMLAVPVADTIKRGDAAGRVTGTVDRDGLWMAQTPQVFRRDWLLNAYARRATLGNAITDDARLVESAGHAVYLVPGSAANLKITTRDDLSLAAAILQARERAR